MKLSPQLRESVFILCASLQVVSPLNLRAQGFISPPSDGPSQEDIQQMIRAARSLGQSQGQSDGSREGQDRGPEEGREAGRREGYREGFRVCEEEEERKAYRRGYDWGAISGARDGENEGREQGFREGRRVGEINGYEAGRRAAQDDARRVATPAGQQQGIQEAEASDARTKGAEDGRREGDVAAQVQALKVDYPRGREDFRNEKFAEEILNREAYPIQNPPQDENLVLRAAQTGMSIQSHVTSLSATNHRASPDNRYYNPRENFPIAQAQSAYLSAYSDGYRSGFQSSYQSSFRNAYDLGYRNGYEGGCVNARKQNYDDDFRRGERKGYDDAYRRLYDSEYNRAYYQVYYSVYEEYKDRAYRQNYDSYYRSFFEEARAAAYRSRYQALYDAAYGPEYRRVYAAVYPKYAAEQYARGRSDEAADFEARPLRLLQASITEGIPNGLFEPGEGLRIKFQFRNFSKQNLNGKDLRLKLEAVDSKQMVVTQPELVLTKTIANESLNEISEAMEFVVNESQVSKPTKLRLRAFYKDRDVGVVNLEVTTQFQAKISLDKEPQLREGILSPVFVAVSNQSQKPIKAGSQVTIRVPKDLVEVDTATLTVPEILPGQTAQIEFLAMARSNAPSLRLNFAFEMNNFKGRRISTYEVLKEVPLVNDYRLLVGNASAIKNSLRLNGLTQVPYTIRNESSRLLFKGLQLKIRVKGDAEKSHVVLGPNPQYLVPLQKGQSTQFLVPVFNQKAGTGGVLELEVQEDGQPVVIHQLVF